MTAAPRHIATLLIGVLLAGLAACGTSSPQISPAEPTTPAPSADSAPAGQPTEGTISPSGRPSLTPVPGGATPEPAGPGDGTTLTGWGRILDRVPEGFPLYPGAEPAEGVSEPASGAWITTAATGPVADWYVGAFEELGWSSIDLGSALEDGTQLLDLASDLPECRVQVTIRPAGRSTMILVLYGAGCAGGDG